MPEVEVLQRKLVRQSLYSSDLRRAICLSQNWPTSPSKIHSSNRISSLPLEGDIPLPELQLHKEHEAPHE